MCVRVCFEGVFSNPVLYCAVVQLEVKQLFYCDRESDTEVTIRASMKRKQTDQIIKQEKDKGSNFSAGME